MQNSNLLINAVVKQAFDALQKGDKDLWDGLFAWEVVFTDDGNTRDFEKFFSSVFGNEYFTSIDSVENEGKDIYGDFHSDQWGDFKVFLNSGLMMKIKLSGWTSARCDI